MPGPGSPLLGCNGSGAISGTRGLREELSWPEHCLPQESECIEVFLSRSSTAAEGKRMPCGSQGNGHPKPWEADAWQRKANTGRVAGHITSHRLQAPGSPAPDPLPP